MCAIELDPVIKSERLRLRRPRKADAARVAVLADDFDVARMTTRMPYPYGLADAHAFLETIPQKDPAKEAVFAVDHPQDGVIGVLGFHLSEEGHSELGYWLGRPYWGHGYATEAARAAMAWAKHEWRRRLVVAGHFADNPASGEVLCKAGFLYTGEVLQQRSLARGGTAASRRMVWLA
jgi:RimJ/RimL family protein N-acetyltransferase